MWEFSGMVWRVGEILDIDAQIDWFAEAGFEAISLHGSAGKPGAWRGIDAQTTSVARRKQLRERLACFSGCELHAPYSAVPAPSDARRTVDALKPTIQLAHDVGASILTVHGIAPTHGVSAEGEGDVHEWSRALECMDGLAGKAGLTVGLENLPGKLSFVGPRRSHVGVTLDVGHLHSTRLGGLEPQSLGEVVRTLGEALVNLHLHDHDGTVDHLAPGTGQIDFEALFSALAEVKYGGPICLELDPDRVSPQEIRSSRERVGALAHRFA